MESRVVVPNGLMRVLRVARQTRTSYEYAGFTYRLDIPDVYKT